MNQFAPDNEIQLSKAGRSAFIKTSMLSGQQDFQPRSTRCWLERPSSASRRTIPTASRLSTTWPAVGPTISRELTTNAFWAVIIASLAIVLYLTVRFAIGGVMAGLKFGTCAVIALVHDACFILGLFAILGKFLGWEVDSLFVTAVLTIIGFSVHDTIVVFDRIRENLRHRLRGESFEQLCNRSILQTIARSINTSFTVVMTLAALVVFGGPLLRHFYVALMAGIIIGTYSSIFNATPLVIVWEKLGAKIAEPARKIDDETAGREADSFAGRDAEPRQTAASQWTEPTGSNGDNDAAKAARIKRRTAKKKRF